jgi:two-component system alkaline phosphatase synthesis response regulator PhoP
VRTNELLSGPPFGDEGSIQVGPLCIMPEEFLARLNGEQLVLTNKEFALLVLLAANPGRVLRRDRIAREVWGDRPPGRSIDIHIARLRSRLPDGAIETVVRVGYRFSLT